MSPLRRLLRLAGPLRGWLLLAALASFATLAANVALMAAAPYLISKAALVTGFAAIAVAVTTVRTLAISRAVLRYAERYLTHAAALRIQTHVRVWLYRAIEPLAPGGLLAFRGGDLLARLLADVDALDEFFVRGLVPCLAAALAAAGACAALGLLNWRLSPVLLAFLALAGIATPLAARRLSRPPAARLVGARGELHATLADHVQGLADLMACGREHEVGEGLRRRSFEMGRARRRLAAVRGASAATSAVCTGLGGLALLAIGISLVRAGRVDGVFLAAVPLVGLAAFEGVASLGDAFRQMEVSRAAAARTFDVIDAPAVVTEPVRARPLPCRIAEIELRRVCFRYLPGGPLALDDVSVRVPPGGRLGLTGPSGAGKSTIVGLLLRFWEAQSGEILLNGHDVREYRPDDVRGLVGIVPQRIYLFNGTLRDNLLLADGDADEEQIVEACRRARLGDLLRSLPLGLDTQVGEDGLKLSGGERQRVALARVFLRAAPILILDEATAHLDATTERDVLRAVDAFAATRSALIVSHRPAALALADHVVALPAAGRAALRGQTGR